MDLKSVRLVDPYEQFGQLDLGDDAVGKIQRLKMSSLFEKFKHRYMHYLRENDPKFLMMERRWWRLSVMGTTVATK